MNDAQTSFLFEPVDRRYSVKQITREIADLLTVEFSDVWVEGEISDVKLSHQGHYYFALKDQDAVLNCVCFRGAARVLRFRPDDGIAVAARGRIDVYEARGQYQFIVEALEPRGVGALQLAFDQLKKKLAAEGLFDAGRKRALPTVPHRIGIVTSPSGAAVRDMLQILDRRFPGIHVRIYPSLVQGDGAAEEIAAGVRWFSENPWAEVLIVGRGGGSLEDLWSFNTEVVARAIAASAVPVISAVGHETDFSIADFVADLRAPTPSAAAELVVLRKSDLLSALDALKSRLAKAFEFSLLQKRRRLESLGTDRAEAQLHRRLSSGAQRLDDQDFRMRDAVRAKRTQCERALETIESRLNRLDLRLRLARVRSILDEHSLAIAESAQRDLRRRQHRVELLRTRLETLSPLGILGRGYALVRNQVGTLVRDAATLSEQEQISIRFAKGGVDSSVTRVLPD